jgi:hypothetical protein
MIRELVQEEQSKESVAILSGSRRTTLTFNRACCSPSSLDRLD